MAARALLYLHSGTQCVALNRYTAMDLTASSATMTRNRDFVRDSLSLSRCGTVKGNALRQYGTREELLNANWSGGIDGGSHSSVSSSSAVENQELTQAPLMAVSVGVRSGKRLPRSDKASRTGGIWDNPFSRGRGGK